MLCHATLELEFGRLGFRDTLIRVIGHQAPDESRVGDARHVQHRGNHGQSEGRAPDRDSVSALLCEDVRARFRRGLVERHEPNVGPIPGARHVERRQDRLFAVDVAEHGRVDLDRGGRRIEFEVDPLRVVRDGPRRRLEGRIACRVGTADDLRRLRVAGNGREHGHVAEPGSAVPFFQGLSAEPLSTIQCSANVGFEHLFVRVLVIGVLHLVRQILAGISQEIHRSVESVCTLGREGL